MPVEKIENSEISTPVEKSLNSLMENNYLFDKSFKKQVNKEPNYQDFIKPIGNMNAPKPVNFNIPQQPEQEDNIPEILKETDGEDDNEQNPIFANTNPQMFPQGFSKGLPQGFPQGLPQGLQGLQGLPQGLQGFPQQGFPQGFSQPQIKGVPQGIPQGVPQNNLPEAFKTPMPFAFMNNTNGMMSQGFPGSMQMGGAFGQNPFSGVNREDLPEFLQSILDDTPEYLRY